MEVYVDDMLVKSKEARSYVENLEETFVVLRKYKLKLNPAKCAFGVSGGCFLGFLVQGIKKRLDRMGGNWVEELTSVLWLYRTTLRGSIWESTFFLVYGTEAPIPAELGIPSHRIMHFNEESNSQLLKEHLDLVDELRETTFIRTQRYKSTMINAHNRRVKTRHFQVEDLVLQRVDTLKPVGKLDPKWEDPYEIYKIIENRAYMLENT
ncbi:hypothetical protein Sango_2098900 [Sesamum angolense]|uniref:Reverse transcriptase domain-containing protein n=1 Tax=Sesamum angolense TaxID=2727404 RepID=A0AAE1WBN1_9LAMI|nr:hypothetical protein Sango_2098900 [Sesamum angolense]